MHWVESPVLIKRRKKKRNLVMVGGRRTEGHLGNSEV